MNKEDGAVLVWVALLTVMLFGFAAIAVDAAALYQEHRELQNGADAAALAIAQDCAEGAVSTACTGLLGSDDATAEHYADENAEDDTAEAAVSYPEAGKVRVDTTTVDGANPAGELTLYFARVLGMDTGTTTAYAIAAWGGPGGLQSQLPLTISKCEWLKYTSNGTVYGPVPPGPVPWDDTFKAAALPFEQKLYFHNTSEASPCPAGPAGQDLPGGFGWLDTPEECAAVTDADGWASAGPGVAVPNECDKTDDLAAAVGTVLYLPIYDEINELSGANGAYHIEGYGAFVLTGYNFSGANAASAITGTKYCKGEDRCIYGYFTQQLVTSIPASVGGPSMGITVVGMSE